MGVSTRLIRRHLKGGQHTSQEITPAIEKDAYNAMLGAHPELKELGQEGWKRMHLLFYINAPIKTGKKITMVFKSDFTGDYLCEAVWYKKDKTYHKVAKKIGKNLKEICNHCGAPDNCDHRKKK